MQYIDTMAIGDEMEMRGPVGHFEYVSGGNTILNKKSLSTRKFGFMCGGTGISQVRQKSVILLNSLSVITFQCRRKQLCHPQAVS